MIHFQVSTSSVVNGRPARQEVFSPGPNADQREGSALRPLLRREQQIKPITPVMDL